MNRRELFKTAAGAIALSATAPKARRLKADQPKHPNLRFITSDQQVARSSGLEVHGCSD